MSRAGVTILICTYNGAGRLPATLQHLALQHVPASIGCEVILVDNASQDDTMRLAGEEWAKYTTGISLKIVYEPRPGLTFARERGFREALYDYIILCDDDNWLSPGYVQRAFEIMDCNPRIGILGGLGVFAYESAPPSWLGSLNLYAGGAQAPQSGRVASNLVYGAGAVLRKPAYDQLLNHGFEPLLTDRLGYQLSSGGDHELCYALVLAGYEVWYDEQLAFHHFITANRLTAAYCLTYIRDSSRCFAVLEPYKIRLKSGSDSLTVFRWELVKSFIYHLRRMFATLLPVGHGEAGSDRAMARRLERTMLRLRLGSYFEYGPMKKNFRRVVAFRRRFLSSSRADKVTPP